MGKPGNERPFSRVTYTLPSSLPVTSACCAGLPNSAAATELVTVEGSEMGKPGSSAPEALNACTLPPLDPMTTAVFPAISRIDGPAS